MKDRRLIPIAVVLIAIGAGVLVWKMVGQGGDSAGGVSNEELSSQVAKPAADAPDFGPIDDRFVIGKTPGGPSTPGGTR